MKLSKLLTNALLLGFLLYLLLGGFYIVVAIAVGIYVFFMVLGHIWKPLGMFNVITPFLMIAYFLYLAYKSIAVLSLEQFSYSFMLALIFITAVELIITEVI
jgi:hypothetical protein